MAVEVVGGGRGRRKGREVMGERGRKKRGAVKKVSVTKDARRRLKKKMMVRAKHRWRETIERESRD